MSIPIETEYNTLRNEILSELEMETNLRIAMCTLAITILSFSIEKHSSNLCLAVFCVLIPFRLLIHSKQFGILRISAYLIVKYESRYQSLSWESNVADPLNVNSIKCIKRYELLSRMGYNVASIIGVLATYFYLTYLKPATWYNYIFIIVCYFSP